MKGKERRSTTRKELTMATAKGIQRHSFFKLGKAPTKKDARNFKLAALLKVLPPVPPSWDYDLAHPKFQIPMPMFGNDQFGDCVIAGRAHQTLRFESVEQNTIIGVTANDVLREYWKEEGGKGKPLEEFDLCGKGNETELKAQS